MMNIKICHIGLNSQIRPYGNAGEQSEIKEETDTLHRQTKQDDITYRNLAH